MKETRTINLNGMAYHIDYDAYQLLREYISDIELRLPMDTRPTVVAELESRIADIFQQALYANNVQVVNIAMVEALSAATIGTVVSTNNNAINRAVNFLINIPLLFAQLGYTTSA